MLGLGDDGGGVGADGAGDGLDRGHPGRDDCWALGLCGDDLLHGLGLWDGDDGGLRLGGLVGDWWRSLVDERER